MNLNNSKAQLTILNRFYSSFQCVYPLSTFLLIVFELQTCCLICLALKMTAIL